MAWHATASEGGSPMGVSPDMTPMSSMGYYALGPTPFYSYPYFSSPPMLTTTQEQMFGPALDFSFRNLHSLGDDEVSKQQPRMSVRRTRRSPSGRYNSNVMRLSNNNLVDTRGLYKMALDVVEIPEEIAWLDLSFNEITDISDDILEFPALKMIYLHGNNIRRLSDLRKLTQLPCLHSLTLHGNPLETLPNYRSSIICMFPRLRSLDFAKITDDEKDKAKLHIIVDPKRNRRRRHRSKSSNEQQDDPRFKKYSV